MKTPENKKIIDNIGEFQVDPAAEPTKNHPPIISGQQEADFYTRAGAQYALQHQQQNLGLLGKLFGSNSSAPTNIAGFVILLSFLFVAVSLFFPGNTDLTESRKIIFNIIGAALAFIFGAASKK